ncbi:MAG: protein kinase [Polyangiaceae bacterium]|nr:protein kinase [Polyangiaceae bacterium]
MASSATDPFSLIGQRIHDKYGVESLVGEGGFGVVYRGTHAGFDAPVAIKCLKVPAHFKHAAKAALVRQLREEGRLLLRLSQRSTGIVQAMDVGTHTTSSGLEIPYLVLEWIDGRTLAEDLRDRRRAGEGGRSLREALELLAPAARALAIAHAEMVAHRDIKPENLMLTGRGEARTVKLLDFGIAKVLSEAETADDAQTSGAPPMFTPGYAAPEQFEKRRGASGPWSDVFSLALVFVEVVAGKRALAGGELMDVFRATVDEERRPTLRGLGAPTSDAVEAVLAKALSVEPRARYADAAKLWAALEAAVASEPVARDAPDDLGALPTGEFMAQLSREAGAAERSAATTPGAPRAIGPLPAETDPQLASAPTERATTRGAVELTPARSTVERSPPARRGLWLGAGALALALGAGLWLTRAPPPPGAATPPATAGGASSSAATTTALLAQSPTSGPVSQNPDAAARYKESLASWRSGAPDAAVATLRKAVELDRGLAAGHLRLAIWLALRTKDDARAYYGLAKQHGQSLSEDDRALLDAAGPLLSVPQDLAGFEQRLAALAAGRPHDAELSALLAHARLRQFRYDEALAAADAGLSADPEHVASWVFRAESLAGRGDRDGQLATYEGCVKSVPDALECLNKLVSLRASLGQCPAMLDAAKRLTEIDGKSHRAHRQLAIALHATGGAREGVLEALKRSWSLTPERDRSTVEPRDRAWLAILDGDLEGALKQLDAWLAAVDKHPDQDSHLEPTLAALEVERELGRFAAASSRADAMLRKMGAWTEPTTGDWSLVLARYRLFGGDLSEADFDAQRAQWSERVKQKWERSGRKAAGELEWFQWMTAFGTIAVTPARAKTAVSQMPADAALFSSGRFPTIDMVVGRTFALAGQLDAARAPLERATRQCSFELSDPVGATLAWYHLGAVLEGKGDVAGARAAYERVVARWGKVAASKTGVAAKARLAALPKP